MLNRRTVLNMITAAAVATAAQAAPAKKHHHKNGHNLIKAKLKQNGRHQVDRAGQAAVAAEVSNGKITAMTAAHPQKGNLPAQKVKSRQKLADMQSAPVRVAAADNGAQFAQVIEYYYGWCFDDGIDVYCYWYPADVVIVDATWVEITF